MAISGSAEINVTVRNGVISIVAPDDQAYDLGEDVVFSGINTETYRTYLFITGPALFANGSQIQSFDPPQSKVVSGVLPTFSQASVYGDNTWSWKWSTSEVYLAPGTYIVYAASQPYDKWKLLHSNAARATVSVRISHGPRAVANFTAAPRSGNAPLTITFTDRSTGSPSSWWWNFGDGTYATVKNPVHRYASPGAYTVSLTATNAYGSHTRTRVSYITAKPTAADFSGTPTSGYAPVTVTFTDKSTNGPTAWRWSFGDGTSSAAKNPVHTYTRAGAFTVSLNATNATGSSIKSITS